MTVENVKSAIEKLEAINPSEEYAYEKAILAYLTIKKLPVLLYEIPAETIIFRTRTHETNDFFNTVSDISITPNQFIKWFARCNRPFQSKFYCSENRPTSFMELVEYWAETKNFGEKVYATIGRWKLKKSLTSIIVTTPDKDNRISEFDKEHGAAMETFIGNCEQEIREATTVLYRYLFDKFRKPAKHDPKTYIITTAYCNLALSHSQGQAKGIYYPSVPFAGQGVNFAINSDFATFDNLELTHIIRNEMSIAENENGKHSFTETAIAEATKIDITNNLIEW
ncbi:MAG: RES domain-containing protein [Bacteroidales bacterium]|nr:RES domain-containing protein [Bacteroidales bacterium]NMA23545.1 RES domain-containing protein [Spirochaetales bacterium]